MEGNVITKRERKRGRKKGRKRGRDKRQKVIKSEMDEEKVGCFVRLF